MIHPTVIIVGQSIVHDETFIGPYCIVGFPSTSEVDSWALSLENKMISTLPSKIGYHSSLLSHVVIGEGTSIGSNVFCDHHTYIGCQTEISDGVSIIYGARIYDRVKIGENAWVAGFVCNDTIIEENAIVQGQIIHRFVDAIERVREPSPIIRSGAFVGMGATVIGDVEVGRGAYIAAGAVLTKSARPGFLYRGIPACESGKAPNPFKTKQ